MLLPMLGGQHGGWGDVKGGAQRQHAPGNVFQALEDSGALGAFLQPPHQLQPGGAATLRLARQ